MKWARPVFDLFVFSNVFIALCAVAMTLQAAQLLPGVETFIPYVWFVFFASISSYNFHWWLTYDSVIASPRIEWARRNRWVHFILFVAGSVGAAVYFFLHLLPWWWGIGCTAVATFLYSAPKIPHPAFRALRKIAYGKTIFLSFIWMNVTTLLPLWISGVNWEPVHWLFIFSRYFMIYAICILFDYRDREDDRARGVKSMVTFFSERNVFVLFLLSVLLYSAATILMGRNGMDWTMIAVLLLPGLIGLVVYRYATRNFKDYFFYFVLDGVMALPAFVTLACS